MTNQPCLRLPLRNCRDLLLARQRARQLAQILRFPAHDAAAIAAGAFLVASSACRTFKRCELCFVVAEGELRIVAEPRQGGKAKAAPLALARRLPNAECQLPTEDIAFVLAQMDRLAAPTPFDELVRLHQEMLGLLAALRDCQTHIDTQRHPSAA
jgi:hypothetical protein